MFQSPFCISLEPIWLALFMASVFIAKVISWNGPHQPFSDLVNRELN